MCESFARLDDISTSRLGDSTPDLRAALVQALAERPIAGATPEQVEGLRARMGKELLPDGAELRIAPLRDFSPSLATAALSLAAAQPTALPLKGWIPRDEIALAASLHQVVRREAITEEGLEAVLSLAPETSSHVNPAVWRDEGYTYPQIWAALRQEDDGPLNELRGRGWPDFVLEMLASNTDLGTVLLGLRALGKVELGWELHSELNPHQQAEQAVYAMAATPPQTTGLANVAPRARGRRIPWGFASAEGACVIGEIRIALKDDQRAALLSLACPWPLAKNREAHRGVWLEPFWDSDDWGGEFSDRVGLAAIRAQDLGRPDVVGDCLLMVVRRRDLLDRAWECLTGIHPREHLAELASRMTLDDSTWNLPVDVLSWAEVDRLWPGAAGGRGPGIAKMRAVPAD